jgi:glucuronokinase
MASGEIKSRVYARIGLLGNPSDGYNGVCIAISLANYWAEVTLLPASTINFHSDPISFPSLNAFAKHIQDNGYYGGTRLLMSITKTLWSYCWNKDIHLPQGPNNGFSLSYATNIPRQAGLSGSSAIACAALTCLIQHYHLQDRVPPSDRPGLVLESERDLGITAGWMDRVIQVYGGVVYMDFRELSLKGRGKFHSIDPPSLPPLYLMYPQKDQGTGKNSGQVHADVRRKWEEGNHGVRMMMRAVADLAVRGREAIENRDVGQLATLMNHNFRIRRQIFGDEVLGERNIDMVEVAQSVGGGVGAKFTGSGGAVVAVCPLGDEQVERLKQACDNAGLYCIKVEVGPVHFNAEDDV